MGPCGGNMAPSPRCTLVCELVSIAFDNGEAAERVPVYDVEVATLRS